MRLTGRRKGRRLLLAGALLAGGAWWAWPALHRPATGPPRVQTQTRAPAGSPGSPAAPPQPLYGEDGCRLTPASAPVPAPPAGLSGRLGLWVAEYDRRTLRPVRALSRDPDGLYPLASMYKQAVLWAVLRAVDAGRLRLSDHFDVTRENQSLGDYPFDHSSVLALAGRMVRFSDNTATDILHRRVGLAAVQGVADDLRLCRTRLILPTKDWWVAQSGLAPGFPGPAAFARATGAERLRLAGALDAQARTYRADYLQRKLDQYFDGRYDPAIDLGTQNVSTPAEFGALVAAEFLRPGLSPASRAVQRQVMATGPGRHRLRLPAGSEVSEFGGKGGNGWRLLTFSGYLHTKDGRDLVYVFMQHGADQTYTMPNSRLAFKWINAALGELVAPGGAAPLAVKPGVGNQGANLGDAGPSSPP